MSLSNPKNGQKSLSQKRRDGNEKIKARYRVLGLSAGALLVIFIAVFGVMGTDAFYTDKICRGVNAGGVYIGGMTAQQAVDLLGSTGENPYARSSVTLNTDAGKSATITAASVDAHADYEATVNSAMALAKSGNAVSKLMKAASVRLFKTEMGITAVYDALKLDEQLDKFAAEVGGTLKQHKIDIDAKEVTITQGTPGRGIDINMARDIFKENLRENKQTSAHIELVDAKPADIDIEELYKMTYAQPVDAHYERAGGGVVVAPHKDGREIDRQQAAKALAELYAGGQSVKVPYTTLAASVTAGQLSTKNFADTLGTFSTKYDTSNKPRANNLAVAARNINGTILLPDEEFSYNKAVGPRTYERGFKDASVYENNKMVDGVGGGICQVSSTLYGASLYANLQIVERHEHSLEVHYAPLGMDATVAWGALDFRIKNNTGAPLKINASAGGGVVSIKLIGTNPHPDWVVKINTETISSTPFTVQEIPSPDIPSGVRQEESSGFKGYVVNTYKQIYQNGKQIENKFLHKSVYTMAPKVIKVGTGPAVTSPAPSVLPGEQPLPSATPGADAVSPAPTTPAGPGAVVTPDPAIQATPAALHTPGLDPQIYPDGI
ncbi:MAG: Vancomycin B-type resistance protein VanW [Firmicutes bacterium ADurb.Bin193]|nr:MAG: Vancomycin B-type resistance protein VanW [Firmicutes bacterium ADurb.Bin193]